MRRHVPAGSDADSLLVPVPLHRWRIWRRGYNQAAIIARAIARLTGAPMALDPIVRRKPTPLLRGLGRKARARAVRGAFVIRPDADVKGRHIILVDDVYTTGATANACAKALKRAGAARVSVLCWARVVRNGEHAR
jgi:ComF family protein